MREFVTAIRGDTSPIVPGSRFTSGDFHGAKINPKNKIGRSHGVDKNLVRLLESIFNWVSSLYPGIDIFITSTKRTAAFNASISRSGIEGAHVKGIAVDFVFRGTNAQGAWCSLKDQVLNKTTIFESWLSLGLGGVGIYGDNGDSGSYFIHIDTRTNGDGLPRKRVLNGRNYGLWTEGNLDCDLAKSKKIENTDEQVLQRERELVAAKDTNRAFEYSHPQDFENATFEDLANYPQFPGKDLTAEEIRTFEYNGKTNNERAYANLSIKEKRELNSGNSAYNQSVDYPVTGGTLLYSPFNKLIIGANYTSNFTITKTSFNNFFPPIIRELTTDPGYIPAFRNLGNDVKQIRPHVRIFLWSKAKYYEDNEQIGFIDLTEDIMSVNTFNSLEGGGGFTIDISGVAIKMEENQDGLSIVRKIQTQDGLLKSNINKERGLRIEDASGSEFIRSISFYQRMITKNDLIFISYEKLKIDGRIEDVVPGKWYDMIGLIDHVEENFTGAEMTSVTIRGKSLIGVLQDDNSYFNPVSIGHRESIFGGDPYSNGRYFTNVFQDMSIIGLFTIKDRIDFIFHRIASIGYIPNDVFSQFKDKTEITATRRNDKGEVVETEKPTKGVWQIIKFFLDDNISGLRLADSSITNPQGSILDLVKKVCQDPFVEFFTDTYGDKFYLIARKPPFEQKALIEAVYQVTKEIDDRFSDYANTPRAAVQTRDSEDVNKYLERISGKTKTTKGNRLVEGESTGTNLDEVVVYGSTFPRIVNINEDDIIEQNLQLSSKGYAWYQLEEQGNFLGAKMGIGIIPLIYFDEIAQVFGNRRLSVVSNYTTLNWYFDSQVDKNRNTYAEQVSQQMAFLVETHIHLPFTREGVLRLNPDRRIKVGNYIYLRPTKEIFYVTDVQNSFGVNSQTIERETIVTVSRGMKIKYIRNREERVKTKDGRYEMTDISYFNIVDIEKLRNQIYDVVSANKVSDKFDFKSDAQVNTDVLEFFLQNRQFGEE